MQNRCGLRHLDHERRAAPGQVVACPYAREDAVHNAQAHGTRWNERAHLRHDHDQRRLPQIGALAAHVRAGKHYDVLRRSIQKQIVGDEALAPCREFLQFDYRMTALDNFQIEWPGGDARRSISDVRGLLRFVESLLEPRPAVISQRRNVRQAAQDIHFRQGQRGLPDALSLGGNGGTQFGKQTALDFDNLLLGIENLGFILFQFGSREALGIHQRLLALVVGGREVQVRFRNLDVITKNGIELYLERADSRALAFTLLHSHQVLLRVATQVAEFVQIFVDAGGDYPAIAQRERRLWNQRAIDLLPEVFEFVDRGVQRD